MYTKRNTFLSLKYRNKTTNDYINIFERNNKKRMKVEWEESGRSKQNVYSNIYYFLKKRPDYDVYVSYIDGDIYLETSEDYWARMQDEE